MVNSRGLIGGEDLLKWVPVRLGPYLGMDLISDLVVTIGCFRYHSSQTSIIAGSLQVGLAGRAQLQVAEVVRAHIRLKVTTSIK